MIYTSDNETDVSYDSSLPRPSPSITSVSGTVPFQWLDYPNSSSLTTPSSLSPSSSSVVSTTTLSTSSSGSSFASSPNRASTVWAHFLISIFCLTNDLYKHSLAISPASPRMGTILPNSSPIAPGRAPKASKRRRPDYRDIALKIDLLAKDLHLRDDARRQESREIMDDITILRSQLRELHRYHPERTTVLPITVTNPRPHEHVSRSVGDSEDISPLEYIDSGDNNRPDTPARSQSSNDASIGSFLSSHHSDEFTVESSS